LCKHQQQTSKL